MMPDQIPSPDEAAIDAKLRRIRPARCRAEFHQRMLDLRSPTQNRLVRPSSKQVRWVAAAAGIAAALTIVGVWLSRSGTAADAIAGADSLPTESPAPPPLQKDPVAVTESPARRQILDAREVALISRGVAPPIQIISVQEARMVANQPGITSPRLEISTCLVPVVLTYY